MLPLDYLQCTLVWLDMTVGMATYWNDIYTGGGVVTLAPHTREKCIRGLTDGNAIAACIIGIH